MATVGTFVVVGVVWVAIDAIWFRASEPGRKVHALFVRPTVTINSFPPGATVVLDGRLKQGQTTKAMLRLGRGSYTVVLKLAGYDSVVRRISVNPENPIVNYDFAFEVPVAVTSRPDGANVGWGGADIGITPLNAKVEVKPGPVEVVLKHTSFAEQPLDGNVNLSSGTAKGNRFLTIASEKLSGKVRWQVGGTFHATASFCVVPKAGSVSVDGRQLEMNAGAASCTLGYGDHRVVATWPPTFAAKTATVTVSNGDRLTRTFALNREITVRVYDTLPDPAVELSSAKVSVDGRGVSEGVRFEMGLGSYDLEVRADGYRPAVDVLDVTIESPATKRIMLERGPTSVRITVRNGQGGRISMARVWASSAWGEEKYLGSTDGNGGLATSLSEGTYLFSTQVDTIRVRHDVEYEVRWPRAEIELRRS
jgi:hypothetical protein